MSEEAPKKPFVPAWLDEAGLSPAQFRVLSHVYRRGQCTSSAATIAAVCRLKRDTVFKVLAELETAKLIRRISRTGCSTVIEPVPPNGTGGDIDLSPQTGRLPIPSNGTGSDNLSPETGCPPSPETGHHPSPQTGHHPSPQTVHKGSPSKVLQEKEEAAAAARRRDVERLMNAHPRPAMTRPALEAVANCIRRHEGAYTVEEIIKATKVYAGCVATWTDDERLQFITSPERFFDEDRWRASPETWASRQGARKRISEERRGGKQSLSEEERDLRIGGRSESPIRAQAKQLMGIHPHGLTADAALEMVEDCIRRNKGLHSFDEISAATQLYADCVARWPQEERKFIKGPKKFFGEDEWKANPETWKSRTKGKPEMTLEEVKECMGGRWQEDDETIHI